ncbi:YciI family protein [uncultured Formosa sp.]|uniref:YciI family protein n=1 Tax=uncultured Formosa sp. TaxID=255435 RepID=UPI0026250711|nr:YciI family protein [uncultured Formosa sp.]
MKYSILIIAILILVSCKKNDNSTPLTQSETDSIGQADMAIDSVKTAAVIKVPKSYNEIKAELTAQGFETYDYIDEETKDTLLIQQYFMAILKGGTVRTQNEEEAKQLQDEHFAYLNKMYELGYADISGAFGDEGDMRGITIYNVPTQKMADSLAKADPMVKSGQLDVDVHPWWSAKGYNLR